MATSTLEAVPVFDGLNTSMFCVAIATATALSAYRWWSHGGVKSGSWISDATGAWSVMILGLLALSAFTRTLPMLQRVQIPSEIELIRSNGLMVPFSFSYCALMLLRNVLADLTPLLEGLRRRSRG